jgi:hypothetical protein
MLTPGTVDGLGGFSDSNTLVLDRKAYKELETVPC